MSAIAALKGYRTQFLYSLYYILSNIDQPYSYRLEGEEDLDVLSEQGHILQAIQVKNLSKTLTRSDLVTQHKTSFLKRFVELYPKSNPVLASFGPINEELKKWRDRPNHKDPKERALFLRAGISDTQISLIKEKVQFLEITEEHITEKILDMLKAYKAIDPVPTAENLLYYIQFTAEKQQLISAKDLLESIDKIGIYLSERIAYTNQYGIFIKPLIKTEISEAETEKLQLEFYHGISARYEHIHLGLDVQRDNFLKSIDQGLSKHNILIISGASGQGKSTLAYRYVFNKAATSLIYEVSLQQDPIKTNEAISAIAALTKGLKVPVYFILHISPNTTSWLKIAREFASHPYLRLLVTIRNEDWFRAQSSEIDFLHTDVELELSQDEAEVIFKRLEDRNLVKTHNDFADAWAVFSVGIPLLEFIHAITQGSSLRDKLKAQVAHLTREETENPIGQLELLKTLCLADALGARIDATLISKISNIKLIIDKFEKEYLLKHSNDGKYLSGLHPIRSVLLAELLFDEFVVCKKDFIAPCLKLIEQQDAYSFLLQALYQRIISAEELITDLKSSGRNTWTIYSAAAKSMLWSGIRTYIDNNAALISEVQAKCGDSWSIVTDIYHGDVIDLDAVLSSISGDSLGLVEYLRDIQKRLSPKSEVYAPMVLFFDQPLPDVPKSYSDWRSFTQTLFWLAKTDNNAQKLTQIKEADFREAFQLLDTQPLALLMLGMHAYSDDFNQIRLNLAPIFNTKVREQFQIPLMEISEELSFDFVVNMTSEDQHTGWHERTINIIDLLRNAYPEVAAFKSQGHGQHLDMLPAFHDETVKHIPAANLPLASWVNINANLIALVDYPTKPDDWSDLHSQLQTWEKQVKGILDTFNRSFQSFKKGNNFALLAPVADQAHYQSLTRLTAPKNTTDPLGIPIESKPSMSKPEKDPKDSKEEHFTKKYDPFFKTYNGYKSAIENFIRQAGQSCYDGAKSVVDSDHSHDEHLLHLTYINLFDAAEKRVAFQAQRDKFFKKFSPSSSTAQVSDSDLFLTATVWKSFWTAIQNSDLKRIMATESITDLKHDFIQGIIKAIKAANKNGNFKITYRNDAATQHLPVFTTQVSDPLQSIFALKACYELIYQCIGGTEPTSLKHLMLQRYFPKIYIISELRGYLFDFKWHEFSLHLFTDTPFGELKPYRFTPQDIDREIASNLKLKTWLLLHPHVQLIREVATAFEKLKLYIGHLADLHIFDHNEKLDELGNAMIRKHFETVGQLTTDTWNELLAHLTQLSGEFPQDLSQIGSEEEQEYWVCMLDVMNGIIPKEAELGGTVFDMASLKAWTERLARLSERWGLFILLLQRRVILSYEIA